MTDAMEARTLELLADCGALMEGHFVLTSGLHSGEYCQCARALEHPEAAEELGTMLAAALRNVGADVVVSPAIGGIIIGHEVARALGVRSVFAEREGGLMALRRGFSVESGERALVIEDVMTTGGSVKEVADVVRGGGAAVAGFGFVVDRSEAPRDLGAPARSLARCKIMTYEPDKCPLCALGLPLVKPGSRVGPGRRPSDGGRANEPE
jgi:orotate phosphoribosyltransferase